MQALYLFALDPIAETVANPNSYGFRKARSCADAVEQCFTALCHANPQWVLEGDIKGCFDNISHEWLLAHVPTDKVILRKWLKSGYMEGQVLYETEDGTPQGGIISPVLANLALDGLERRLRERYPVKGKGSERGRQAGVHLIRYADDFIITGRTKELLETEVRPLVESFLRERGLELSPEKTAVTHVTEGFDFLGQHVRKYGNGKLLIKPSKKNVKSFLDGIRLVVRRALPQTAAELIRQLNPKVRGWANYHRHVVSKRIFSRVDSAIFDALWQWARRRHNRKSRRWIKQKYFCRRRGRDWWFFGESKDEEGRACKAWLYYAAYTPIREGVAMIGLSLPAYAKETPIKPTFSTEQAYEKIKEATNFYRKINIPRFTVRALFQEALSLEYACRWTEAEEKADEVIHLSSSEDDPYWSIRAHLVKARILYNKQYHEKKGTTLKEVLDLLGLVQERSKHFRQSHLEFYHTRGEAYLTWQHYEEAKRDFERARELNRRANRRGEQEYFNPKIEAACLLRLAYMDAKLGLTSKAETWLGIWENSLAEMVDDIYLHYLSERYRRKLSMMAEGVLTIKVTSQRDLNYETQETKLREFLIQQATQLAEKKGDPMKTVADYLKISRQTLITWRKEFGMTSNKRRKS